VSRLVDVFLHALTQGSLYALIALGYTLVYGILRFINFAHSDVVMVGAWVSYTLAGAFGWAATGSPAIAMPVVLLLTMGICAVLGFTIERLAYRPLRRAPRLNVLITAIGVSLFLEHAGRLDTIFGPDPVSMPKLLSEEPLFHIAGIAVPIVDATVVILAIGLLLVLEWLVYRTKLGAAMRAVSFDERTASLMGINVDRVVSITFLIGSALAAAGGMAYGLKYGQLDVTAGAVWVLLGLKAFVAAVVGGIGNIRGAVAGAFLIAFVENFMATYASPAFQDAYVFAILIIVLLVKPGGLFGTVTREKV
jgi:branched-chain amino acid transport system permease protein